MAETRNQTAPALIYLYEPPAEQMSQRLYEELRDKKLALEQVLAEMVEQQLNLDAILYVEREVSRLGIKCALYLECQRNQATLNN